MADIVITEFMDDAVAADLAKDRDVFYDKGLVDRPDDLVREASRCRGLIVRNRTQVTAELLDQCPELKVVGRLGVGLENIDMAACAARGVAVCPARGANAVSVAEYVVATMLMLMRGIHRTTGPVIAGEWPRNAFMGREAAGVTFGLVGFGDIARHAAARASALGMEIVAHDPFVHAEDPVWRDMRARRVSLEELLEGADVITLHVPLTESTRNLIDAAALRRMKDDAILINSARGGIVDEDALVAALNGGSLGGAALDVFAGEPVTAESGARFDGVPNLILTPHIAGVTHQSNRWTSVLTVRNVLGVLDANA
ncbi:MAG: hydroxyacid dehydrogenase [Alphaproteobacteria bacterium]|nr:hydroxyacid dehydrogenase [Alphaproteobacteria bacterium]